MNARQQLERTIAQFKAEHPKTWAQEFLEAVRDSGSVGFQVRGAMTIALGQNSQLAEQLSQPSDRLPLEVLQAQAVDQFMENYDPANIDPRRLSI